LPGGGGGEGGGVPSIDATAATGESAVEPARVFSIRQVARAVAVFPDPGAPAMATRYLEKEIWGQHYRSASHQRDAVSIIGRVVR